MNIWMQSLVDLVYPAEKTPDDLKTIEEPFCHKCGEVFEGDISHHFFCHNCKDRKWKLTRARARYIFAGHVRDLILDFKYHQKFHHLPQLSEWLTEGYQRHYPKEIFDALVPVPLYFLRRINRRFNQAEELSKKLSKKTQIPVLDCLKRIKNTNKQTLLTRSERLKNPLNAFAIKDDADVKGMRLLLIDDVLTTGATADACAKVLKKAGAAEVCALTIARG